MTTTDTTTGTDTTTETTTVEPQPAVMPETATVDTETPEANMIAKADYAVIGDLHKVVPAITAEIRRRRG